MNEDDQNQDVSVFHNRRESKWMPWNSDVTLVLWIMELTVRSQVKICTLHTHIYVCILLSPVLTCPWTIFAKVIQELKNHYNFITNVTDSILNKHNN